MDDGKHLEHSNIHCVFFPPNITFLIQPMDQGVLDTLKRHYRRKLIRRALDEKNEHKSMAEVKKTIPVKTQLSGLLRHGGILLLIR